MGQTGSEGVEMASEMGNIDGEMAKSHEAIDWETRGRWKVTRGDKQSGNPAAASERLPGRFVERNVSICTPDQNGTELIARSEFIVTV